MDRTDFTNPDRAPNARPDRAPNGWPEILLQGFRDGSREALTEVYRMYAAQIATHLRRGFSFESRGAMHRFVGYGSAYELHDVLHETFRRAFEPAARQRYDGIRPYGPYLQAIARNIVLRGFRAKEILFPRIGEGWSTGPEDGRVADPMPEGDAEAPGPEAQVGTEQLRAVVRAFLETLSAAERELVVLRFVDGMSQRDAAARLGLGRQQVRGRETKLRAKLIAYLRERGEQSLVPGSLCLPWVLGAMAAEVLR